MFVTTGVQNSVSLPSPTTRRWGVRRKAQVAVALINGQLTVDQALERWPNLSPEELSNWIELYSKNGLRALRVTRCQDYMGRTS